MSWDNIHFLSVLRTRQKMYFKRHPWHYWAPCADWMHVECNEAGALDYIGHPQGRKQAEFIRRWAGIKPRRQLVGLSKCGKEPRGIVVCVLCGFQGSKDGCTVHWLALRYWGHRQISPVVLHFSTPTRISSFMRLKCHLTHSNSGSNCLGVIYVVIRAALVQTLANILLRRLLLKWDIWT